MHSPSRSNHPRLSVPSRKTIKSEKGIDFDVDADKLTLWRVSIPIPEDDDENPILLNDVTSDKKKLRPTDGLANIIVEPPPKNTIHIVLQRPPPSAFWLSLNRCLKSMGFVLKIYDSTTFLAAFSTTYKRWDRPVVLFFDEFDKLLSDRAVEARSSMLSTIRGLKNSQLPLGDQPHVIHSIVSIGTYAILKLNQPDAGLSPFNTADDFQNTSLSFDQVRMLYRQFAADRGVTIADEVMDSIFSQSRGHAGLVNVCGVAMDASLGRLPDGSAVDMAHWGSVRNNLLSAMGRYGTFQRLIDDLTQDSEQQQALRFYRLEFLGSPIDHTYTGSSDMAEYLAALGVLYPDPADTKTFKIASPLMDSYIRQMCPEYSPPKKPNRTLDILEIIRSSLRLFDKEFVDDATYSSFKTAHVPVNGRRENEVPRESVYDSEITRICKNWLTLYSGYAVTGQYHYQQRAIVLELIATETEQQIQSHVTRTVEYKQSLNATESWVIHFTRQDNYLQAAHWPEEADFDQGINAVHIWHDQDFTEVRLSAKWKSEDGKMMTVVDERVI
ncbi:hypothetical protein BG004_007354 [Podila humilis]|nr:hypothetical protein BG004_007354 [Podila humilis]